MTGSISSAQARVILPETVLETKPNDGSISSRDLLTQPQPAPVVESAPEPIEVQQPEALVEQPRQDSPRFRDLRLKAEATERESREKDEIIQRLLRAQQQQHQPQSLDRDTTHYDEDEIVSRKTLTPLMEEVRNLKQELQNQRHYSSAEQSRQNMRQRYNDYDKVMTADNLKDLEYMKPAIAKALSTSGDFEGSAEIAYHMIKNLNIHQDDNTEDIEDNKRRARENMAKPKPANSVGKSNSPLSELSPFHREQTKEHKDMLWSRMQKKMRTKKSF